MSVGGPQNISDRPQPAKAATPSRNNRLLVARYVVMAIACLVFLWIASMSWTVYKTYRDVETKQIDLEDLPYNDITKLAIDTRLDQSKGMFTYNVLLLGILWGLILVRKEGPVITSRDIPEGVVFILANLAIILNTLCHTFYMRLITSIAAAAAKRSEGGMLSILNFLDKRIDIFAEVQQMSLVGVLVLVALVVFSTHKLKEPQP
jgi:hypothetical protein